MTWTTLPRSEVGPLAAHAAGTGPRIVLLHGVGLRAEAWNGQIGALVRAGFKVIAPDMPGHGESPNLPDLRDLRSYADLAAACLDEPAVVVGHSMGAMIALDLVPRYPGRLRGVVALNAVYRRSAAAKERAAARVSALGGVTNPDSSQTLERWFGVAPSPERAACARWLNAVDPAGYKSAYAVFAREDGPPDAALRSLHVPALFMTGDAEPNSTPQMAHDMAALAPDGRAEIVAGAAHMMPMTHADAVSRSLVDFARECHS